MRPTFESEQPSGRINDLLRAHEPRPPLEEDVTPPGAALRLIQNQFHIQSDRGLDFEHASVPQGVDVGADLEGGAELDVHGGH